MKKSLVALAVLAASGASMAQVSLTGALGFSFQKDRTTPTAVQGMQMADGHVTFAAKEDLGDGFSVTAKSEFQLRGRDTAVTARDATISLMTPVGLLTLGTVEADNSIIGRGWAGAPVSLPTGFDGGIIGGGNKIDVLAFNTKLAGVVVGLSYAESGTQDIKDLAKAFGPALTGGEAGNQAPGGPGGGKGPLQAIGLNASYADGPLNVGISFGRDSVSLDTLTDVSGMALVAAAYDGRVSTNISGSYDFGVAKVGAGFSTKTKGWAKEMVFGVSVPLGAATVGLIYANKTDDSVTLGDGVRANSAAGRLGFAIPTMIAADVKGTGAKSGVAIGVDYALSKSTAFNVSYGVYDIKDADRGYTVNSVAAAREKASSTNEYRIRLLKTF